MSSRAEILGNVRLNRGPAVPLPDVQFFLQSFLTENPDKSRLVDAFCASLEGAGGKVINDAVTPDEVLLKSNFPDQKITTDLDSENREALEVFVVKGVLGVAENGAIWVPENVMGDRVAPFITQHLVIVLHRDMLVMNMHDAYQQIDASAQGFGVFIAGPSKTADIEQSLVIGAHGPRSLTVILR